MDYTTAHLDQGCLEQAGQMKGGSQIDCQDLVKSSGVCPKDLGSMGIGNGGIVDQNMKASRGQGLSLMGQAFNLGLVRQISQDKRRTQLLLS